MLRMNLPDAIIFIGSGAAHREMFDAPPSHWLAQCLPPLNQHSRSRRWHAFCAVRAVFAPQVSIARANARAFSCCCLR